MITTIFHCDVCKAEDTRLHSGTPHGWEIVRVVTRNDGSFDKGGSYRTFVVCEECWKTGKNLFPTFWRKIKAFFFGAPSDLEDMKAKYHKHSNAMRLTMELIADFKLAYEDDTDDLDIRQSYEALVNQGIKIENELKRLDDEERGYAV